MKELASYRIPVEQGRFVEVKCLSKKDVAAVRREVNQWKRFVCDEDEDRDLDAIEMGKFAVRRWTEAHKWLSTAASLSDFRDKIRNGRPEVHIVLVARAPWIPQDPVVAICHFRRTWSGNFAVGFLASRPGSRVGAIGVGLLHRVAVIARSFRAPAIWGETSPTSKFLYQKIFHLKAVKDLVYLQKPQYRKFISEWDAKPKTSEKRV